MERKMTDIVQMIRQDVNQVQGWIDDQSEILTRAKVEGIAVKEHVLLRFAIERLKGANENAHLLMEELRKLKSC